MFALTAQSAFAQDVADAAEAPAEEEAGGDIVVTAQKQEEFLKDVPSSIAVLTGDTLQEQGADKLEDYVARVPGLYLNGRGLGQQQVSIRGISTGPQFASTVAVYLDESPVGSSTGGGAGGLITPDVDSIDLQRVEVLRGPQGTLYGASNIGGLLKYVTVAPDTNDLEGAAGIEAESIAHGGWGYAARGRVNVPIVTDKAAILVTGYTREDPGFIDDAGRGARNVNTTTVHGGRISLLLTPTDSLSIRATIMGQDREADGFALIDVDPATHEPLYGQFEQRRAEGSEGYRSKLRLYYLTADYDFGGAQLTSTTSYSTLRYRGVEDLTAAFGPIFGPILGIPNLGFSAAYEIPQDKFSQEVRLAARLGSKADLIAGVIFTEENSKTIVTVPTFDTVTGDPVVLPSPLLNSEIDGRFREYAAFGQLTYQFSPRFDLIAGIRHARNSQRNVSTSEGDLVGPPTVDRTSTKDNSTTFTISPRFKLNDDVTVYARVASGYRPGGTNESFSPFPTYAPDTVVNYEAGIKGSIPASRLSFEIAAFYIDWKDIQLTLRTPLGLGFIGNAGAAISQGVEASGSYSPVRGLTFSASAAYTDAHLKRDIPSGQFGERGDALPYSPKWKSALNVDYEFPVSDSWTAFVGASHFYTGRVLADFARNALTPRRSLPAYSTFDARLGIRNERWTLELIAKNIGDETAYNSAGPATLSLIQPRTIAIGLRTNF